MQVGTKMWYSNYFETYEDGPMKMTMKPNIYDQNCPTRLVLDRIADKWTVLIIGQLSTGILRFNELKRLVPGITQKMLTQTLKGLERDGMISRKVYATVPPKVEYQLTSLGNSLVQIVEDIRVWAEAHIETILRAQKHYNDLISVS